MALSPRHVDFMFKSLGAEDRRRARERGVQVDEPEELDSPPEAAEAEATAAALPSMGVDALSIEDRMKAMRRDGVRDQTNISI